MESFELKKHQFYVFMYVHMCMNEYDCLSVHVYGQVGAFFWRDSTGIHVVSLRSCPMLHFSSEPKGSSVVSLPPSLIPPLERQGAAGSWLFSRQNLSRSLNVPALEQAVFFPPGHHSVHRAEELGAPFI